MQSPKLKIKFLTTIQINLEFGNVGFMEKRGKSERLKKRPLGARTRTSNKLNPHGTDSRNRTQATLVGVECSHHCAIPTPLNSS